jgi:hypothetical protein
VTLFGEPIVYSMTIPTSSANSIGAAEFIALALGREGRAIFARNGQRAIDPPRVTGAEALPTRLLDALPEGVVR